MQDFCNEVSISKKLAADKINATGEFKDMYLCVSQTGVQSILSMQSMLILGGSGGMPPRKF